MKKVLLLFLFQSSLLFTFSISSVYAQSTARTTPQPTQVPSPQEAPPTGVSLTLSPVFLNLTTDPGQKVTSQFRITNNNNFRDFLEIEIKKFIASDAGTGPVIQDVQSNDEFIQWVDFSETQFTLDANQTKTIRFTISPPEEAALGYYYAFVVNRMKNAQGESGATIAGSPALPVLLSVKSENAKREIQITDFKTDKLFYEELPANFIVTIKNTGNIHVAPAGDIFIDSMVNKEIGIIHANRGRGNILPNSTRSFTTAWDDGFISRVPKVDKNGPVTDDNGNPVYTTKYDFTKADKFRIGKYTANLVVVYNDGERDVPVEAQVSFWIIPWKILLVALLICIFILFGIKSMLWNPIRKLLRNEKKK